MRAIATTDPKEIEGQNSYLALFQGTYDLKGKKWTVTDARRISLDESHMHSSPRMSGLDLENNTFATEEGKLGMARWTDE